MVINMSKLILYPTDTCQWHALINEAQAATRVVLNEETESYLVFLLMRFSQSIDWVESVIALDFLKSMHATLPRQVELLRDVGDKSLVFSGLFPEIATRRHVQLEYYTEMGQAAYLTASELQSNESSELYYQLSMQFINLQNILQSLRGYGSFKQSDSGLISTSSVKPQ